MTQDELVKRIKVLVEKGDHEKEKANYAKEKAEQFYKSAGLHLIELKAAHKGTWLEWEGLVKKECGIGKSRASELMRIAGGHTTMAGVRFAKAKSMRNVRASSPPRGGEKPMPDLADIIRDHDAQRIVDLQSAWDAAPAEAKQEFVETNAVALTALLAQHSKKAASAVADRAVEQTPPLHLAPIPPDDYPELPGVLKRTTH